MATFLYSLSDFFLFYLMIWKQYFCTVVTVRDDIPVTKVCAFIVSSDTVHLKCPNANLCGFCRRTQQHGMLPATCLPSVWDVVPSRLPAATCWAGHRVLSRPPRGLLPRALGWRIRLWKLTMWPSLYLSRKSVYVLHHPVQKIKWKLWIKLWWWVFSR